MNMILHSIKPKNIKLRDSLSKDAQEEDKYTTYIKSMYAYENQEWDAIWDSIKAEGSSWWD